MTRRERRLSALLGMSVTDVTGAPLGHVSDVRLAPTSSIAGGSAELVVEEVLVSRRFSGSLMGYDRRKDQGPWLVRSVIQRLNRTTFRVPWSAVTQIDWQNSALVIAEGEYRRLLKS